MLGGLGIATASERLRQQGPGTQAVMWRVQLQASHDKLCVCKGHRLSLCKLGEQLKSTEALIGHLNLAWRALPAGTAGACWLRAAGVKRVPIKEEPTRKRKAGCFGLGRPVRLGRAVSSLGPLCPCRAGLTEPGPGGRSRCGQMCRSIRATGCGWDPGRSLSCGLACRRLVTELPHGKREARCVGAGTGLTLPRLLAVWRTAGEVKEAQVYKG